MTNIDPLETERMQRQKNRNRALLIALLVFIALVYAVTIVKMKITAGL